jgi:hypothetical protein
MKAKRGNAQGFAMRSTFPPAFALAFWLSGSFSPASALAEEPAPISREANLIVYGNDPCPQPADADEIVVCARLPEDERYRIPRRLRQRPDQPTEVSWASRVAGLEEESRQMRPNSCSVVGSFGQTGCTQAMIRQWFDQRRAMAAEQAGIP